MMQQLLLLDKNHLRMRKERMVDSFCTNTNTKYIRKQIVPKTKYNQYSIKTITHPFVFTCNLYVYWQNHHFDITQNFVEKKYSQLLIECIFFHSNASNDLNIVFFSYIINLKVILICTFWSNKKQQAYIELTTMPKNCKTNISCL